ncbi:MAG: hypothetical protein Q8928_07925 [Bacteroidota bacterium]|nr:hypothetical protein [Bacteroidota bacterium]
MTFQEFIQLLKNTDLQHVSRDKIIYTLHKNGIRLPILTSIIKKGEIIERGRISHEGRMFSSECEISYRTDIEKIDKYGRANRPFQSMFYGSSPTRDIKHPTIVLFSELVEQFRNISKSNFETTMTVGRWIVIDDFEVADICFSENYFTVDELKNRFELWVQKIQDTELNEENYQNLLSFFSNEFAKANINNHHDYKISSIYTDYVLNEKLNGICYPSVRTDYQGRNFALLPSAVEEYMELREAAVFKYTIQNGEPLVINTHYSNELGAFNSRFVWKIC